MSLHSPPIGWTCDSPQGRRERTLEGTGLSTPPRNTRSARNVLAGVLTLVPFVVVLVTGLLWRTRLPESLPAQWSGDTVTSTQPTLLFLAVTLGTALIAGLFALVAGLTPVVHHTSRLVFFVSGTLAGVAAAAWTISGTLGIETRPGEESGMGAWGLLAIGSVAYGLLPLLVARRPAEPRTEDPLQPVTPLPPETVAFSHTMKAPVLAWVAVGALVIGGLSLAIPLASPDLRTSGVIGTVLLVVVVFLAAATSRVRVTADQRGLSISPVLAPFLVKRVRLADIAAVRAENLNPGSWGGWGYRIAPGRSAVIIRGGAGVVVTLRNGKEFAVTVDDSRTLAALLTTLSAPG